MTGDTKSPADGALYLANVEATVKRLRNHPSLAYYVSSNESTEMPGARELIHRLDPTRGYQMQSECDGVHDGSPYRQVNPMCHYENTASDRGSRIDGFNPEYGAPTLPVAESLRAMMDEKDLWPVNKKVWDYHDGGGFHLMTSLYAGLVDNYGPSASIDEFALKGQLVGAVNAKSIWETWNCNKLDCGERYASGLLFWYHNCPVPQVSARMWDYFLEPTASFYHTQNALEPLHPQFDYLKNTVSVVNGRYEDARGLRLAAEVYNLDSSLAWQGEAAVDVAADGVACDVMKIDFPPDVSSVHFIKLRLFDRSGRQVGDNFYWRSTDAYKGRDTLTGPCASGFGPLAGMPGADVSVTVVRRSEKTFDAELVNTGRTIAFFLRLQVKDSSGGSVRPCFMSDNFFSLLPGERKTVRIDASSAPSAVSSLALTGWNVKTAACGVPAALAIDTAHRLGAVSPHLFGQFIEYMGRCIDGGVYDEKSPRSDADGIRRDVLEKAKELAPTMIRFPGGTFVKTFHWEDGVGPKESRRASKNLIWGGVNTFRFGTCEFIDYCRAIGAEPVLVVNVATGTPEEAANWVEYCNGTNDTYYANLRRSHGYPAPFNVKYWALGNEEAAEPDAGRHQNPDDYVGDMWHFIKLMKLTDPSIELIADGERGIPEWNKTVLRGLDGAIDYISFHAYVETGATPCSIFSRIDGVERELAEMARLVKECSSFPVKGWKKWYRFPARAKPVKIALDEWGIWEKQEPPYGTTVTYEWRHALATAWFLNAIMRQADNIGMANWAQMVNILAPIMTSETDSIRQTVFYPLREYRRRAVGESVAVTVSGVPSVAGIAALNCAVAYDSANGRLTLCAVNIGADPVKADVFVKGAKAARPVKIMELTGVALDARNILAAPEKDVVRLNERDIDAFNGIFPAESIVFLEFKLTQEKR